MKLVLLSCLFILMYDQWGAWDDFKTKAELYVVMYIKVEYIHVYLKSFLKTLLYNC